MLHFTELYGPLIRVVVSLRFESQTPAIFYYTGRVGCEWLKVVNLGWCSV